MNSQKDSFHATWLFKRLPSALSHAILPCFLSLAISLSLAQEVPLEPDPSNDAYPKPISTWSEAVKKEQRDAAQKMVSDLTSAVARGDHKFQVPPGNYRFCHDGAPNLVLKDVSDFEIDATGSTFWFEDPSERIDRISLNNCHNVTFRGATIDFDPLPCSQGEIFAINPDTKKLSIRIDPGFALPSEAYFNVATMPSVKAAFCDPSGVFRAVPLDWVKQLTPLGDRDYEVSFKQSGIF